MGDLKTSIILDLSGNLQSRAKQFSGALQGMSTRGSRSMQVLGRSMHSVSNGIDRLGNKYTALLTGAVGAGSVRYVAELQKRLSQLRVDSRASAEEIENLQAKLFEVARSDRVRLDPALILAGIEEIVTKTGDLDFAIENMEALAVTIRAAGAAGEDIGSVMTNLYKGGVRDPRAVLSVMDALIQQAKEGSVAFRDTARVGNRLFAPYIASGQAGEQAFKDMGAVAQATIDAVGSPEEMVTATSALLAQLRDPNMQKFLSGVGVKVFDGKEMRSLPLLIEEIIQAAGGDISKLGTKFNESAIKVFQGALMEGNRQKIQRLAGIVADGSAVMEDAAINTETLDAALTSLANAWRKFAVNELSEPIEKLAKALNDLDMETVDQWLRRLRNLGLGLGGLIVANKAIRLGKPIYDLFRKKSGIGGAAGALGGAMGAVPVYVVNGPMSQLPSPPGRGRPGAPGGSWGRTGMALRAGGASMLPGALTLASMEGSVAVGRYLAEQEAASSSTSRLRELLTQHAVLGGGPENYQSRLIKDELARRGEVDVGGTINIRFDDSGRPRVQMMQSHNPNVDFDVDTGRSMVMP